MLKRCGKRCLCPGANLGTVGHLSTLVKKQGTCGLVLTIRLRGKERKTGLESLAK